MIGMCRGASRRLVYGNFGNAIEEDARNVLRWSADRQTAGVRGDYEHLT